MNWLKRFASNIVALALAAFAGAVATSQVIYVFEIPTGALPIAPLFRGFVVSIVVAATAPRTGFRIRLAVFTGIYLLDLALSIITAAAAIELLNSYFEGDREAAKPWTYGGAIIPFVTGIIGFRILRLHRSEPQRIPA